MSTSTLFSPTAAALIGLATVTAGLLTLAGCGGKETPPCASCVDAGDAGAQAHYLPSVALAIRRLRSAVATPGGTIAETSPPNCATSLTSEELT